MCRAPAQPLTFFRMPGPARPGRCRFYVGGDEILSRYCSLPEHAPLALCRDGKSVRVLRYGRALLAIKELMAKSRPARVAYLWSDDMRGRRRHIEPSESKRGEVDIRRDQVVYA